MARKNRNAGQLNREAQVQRHARRRHNNEAFKQYRKPEFRSDLVLGPGSEHVLRGRSYGELIVREKVSV